MKNKETSFLVWNQEAYLFRFDILIKLTSSSVKDELTLVHSTWL